MQEDYRKWMIEKLKDKFRFELISMFSFGETVWEAATKAAEEKFTFAQHTQPAICAWLKANSMCSKWGHAGAKVCIACEAPRKQQASA